MFYRMDCALRGLWGKMAGRLLLISSREARPLHHQPFFPTIDLPQRDFFSPLRSTWASLRGAVEFQTIRSHYQPNQAESTLHTIMMSIENISKTFNSYSSNLGLNSPYKKWKSSKLKILTVTSFFLLLFFFVDDPQLTNLVTLKHKQP